MDPNNIVISAISVLLALSGFLAVAEALGFLPQTVSRWLNRNRLAQTLAVLRELGLDIDRLKRRHIASSLVEHFQISELPMRVQKALEPLTLQKAVGVGGTEIVQAERYIDLMGATTDPRIATMFARYLETFWRNRILADEADPDISFIVTPKAGSPILGYEFARNLELPFAMHTHEKKFEVSPDEFRAHFDCGALPAENGRALIVDDSSTGGGKVLELITDLRKFGYDARDCIIVFEPQLKEARRKILDHGVRVHSITKV